MKLFYIIVILSITIITTTHAQSSNSRNIKRLYADLDTLDQLLGLKIDTTIEYDSKDSIEKEINYVVGTEMKFIMCFDSSEHNICDSTKGAINYSKYIGAIRKGRSMRCLTFPKPKQLAHRLMWVPVKKYRVIPKEERDFTGFNMGSDEKPIGTMKPLKWESKYIYTNATIEIRTGSNKDGDDDFRIYTTRETLFNNRMPRNVPSTVTKGIHMPTDSSLSDKPYRSRIHLSVSNFYAKKNSPGAYDAHITITPDHPIQIPYTVWRLRLIKTWG